MTALHKYPALHNAMWPGLVGKGPDSEPAINLDTMLNLTAATEVDGVRFDGVDLFLALPHTDIDSSDDDLAQLAEKLDARNLCAGSLVAPVWEPTGGGSAMGSSEERARFLTQVRKACRIGRKLRELDARPYGVIRIDSATGPAEWANDPQRHTKTIAETFREAGTIAQGYGEKLAAEGEICWAGMHSWRRMKELLEEVDMPGIVGFQADMAHTMLFTMGHNAPEDRLLPADFEWSQTDRLAEAYREVARALRPWTLDFHIAQNDGTVSGSGSHDKTGRHCRPLDPNGKLDIVRDAGAWMTDDNGHPTRAFQHICWDGCMFPNSVMMNPEIWNDVLRVMIAVRNAHGWD
ncbi:MAG: sugar phosphate isomerase/epimerase [Acidobacteriota bacterium]|nr:sugar phosphate isomerase/epimerase [Acidobacteriota bacterium]